MSRVKEFDVGEACDSALTLFRRQGYEATSVSDLVTHLGVAKASLYATFGTKHDLYVTALKRYAERTDARVMAQLSEPGSGVAAVRRLFDGYTAEILGDDTRMGCFVVNAAIELLPHDPEVARLVERSWDTLEVALTMALERAKAQDELPAGSDPATLARFLLTVLQGLRVLGKGTDAASRVHAAVSQAMRLLIQE
ncbi:TetR/AcrR family transcriptional regulator [Amycolatopsis sp. DG1A-15b]|uniref:TetR/AcrR family transcriptional regulator n=1 Tax=Amycolatopsis sp. DG1A-15b TaxID=3052846 RepID=UPI00255B992A|nr:TetR/AcrR family transcriptional regulator [Amycolatopsis sp. DG1A-15b]WIX88681.1 TetR/AcrR family transcriptional regulator [Amycolatopsis sp. DG1A-15b]